MDPEAALGAEMSRTEVVQAFRPAISAGLTARTTRVGAAVPAALLLVCLQTSFAHAADRYVVVITGASGGSPYAEKYNSWRTALVSLLKQKLKYPDDRLFVLAESEGQNVAKATRENVRRLFDTLRSRLAGDDTLFVFLIGHGTTADNDDAKFNLVGPDLTTAEWSQLLKPVPGRLVFIDTTAASYPFMPRLAAPGRVVVTATDTAAQQFETIFPEFVVQAFDDPAADGDKNGRVSIWEAFNYASAGVKQRFERNGQLATERPLLDDNGDVPAARPRIPGRTARSRVRFTWRRSPPILPATIC